MNLPGDGRILKPLPRERLADQVYQVVVRYIHHRDVAVGDRLPSERRFSELLEVSRTVVRAALARLEAEGYVERQVGVGIILTRRPPLLSVPDDFELGDINATLQEVYQARIALEVGAMDWVVRGLTEEDLNVLEALVDRMAERVAANRPVVREDRAFHVRLIEACRNSVIIQFASIINQYFDRMRIYSPEIALGHQPHILEVQHRMILMALQARDTEAARQAMRLHFRPLKTLLQEAQRKEAPLKRSAVEAGQVPVEF